MECAKVTAGVRKVKKKPVKDELDRMKQAEKKKRRLEKALATSLAIRSELEKKKQKKKEEQERLDEEGAAIAEAVALHVLLGEDSDESSKLMLKKDEGPATWVRAIPPPVLYQDLSKNNGYMCNHWGNSNLMGSFDSRGREFFCPRYVGEDRWGNVGISAGHIAAQAVSSLRIGDDARVEAYMLNRMLRG